MLPPVMLYYKNDFAREKIILVIIEKLHFYHIILNSHTVQDLFYLFGTTYVKKLLLF